MRSNRGNVKLFLLFSFVCLAICFLLQEVCSRNRFGDENKYKYVLNPTQETFQKRVTKSLSELGRVTQLSGHVLMFNRVPKSGSEIFILLLQWLQGRNSFKHIRLAGDGTRLSRPQQKRFAQKVSNAIQEHAVPLSFDRSVFFTNFSSFGWQSPTYVNIIRNPMERIQTRSRPYQVNTRNLVECWTDTQGHKCLVNGSPFEPTIPYYCGHELECTKLNSKWALGVAKENVDRYFSVVGILEFLNETLFILENHLPLFFRGASDIYAEKVSGNHRMSTEKPVIEASIKEYLMNALSTEFDFYNWVIARLFQQVNHYKQQNKITINKYIPRPNY